MVLGAKGSHFKIKGNAKPFNYLCNTTRLHVLEFNSRVGARCCRLGQAAVIGRDQSHLFYPVQVVMQSGRSRVRNQYLTAGGPLL